MPALIAFLSSVGGRLGPRDGRWAAVAGGRRSSAAAVVAMMGVGAAVRWWNLSSQSVWYDELLTVTEARLGFGAMLHSVRVLETTPPLYFVVVWSWGKAFGDSVLALRSLSVVAGVLTIPAAFAFARKLAGRRAGLVACVLTTFSPLLVWYSQEARSYSLFVLLGTLSLWLSVRAASSERRRGDLWLWSVSAACLIGVHYFAVFLLIPQMVWLWRRLRPDLSTARPVLLPLIVGGCLLPSALASSSNGTGWIGRIPLELRLRQVAAQYLAGFNASPVLLVTAATLATAGVTAGLVFGTPRQRTAIAWCLATSTAGVGLAVAPAVIGVDFVVTRNLLPLLIPLLAGLAVGISALPSRALAVALTIAFAAVGGAQVAAGAADVTSQRPEWQRVARELGAGGPRVIVVGGGYRALPLGYYLPRTRQLIGATPIRELVVVGATRTAGDACWWGSRCNLPPQVPSPVPPSRDWRAGPRRISSGFITQTFYARHPITIRSKRGDTRSHRRFLPKYARESTLVLYERAAPAHGVCPRAAHAAATRVGPSRRTRVCRGSGRRDGGPPARHAPSRLRRRSPAAEGSSPSSSGRSSRISW